MEAEEQGRAEEAATTKALEEQKANEASDNGGESKVDDTPTSKQSTKSQKDLIAHPVGIVAKEVAEEVTEEVTYQAMSSAVREEQVKEAQAKSNMCEQVKAMIENNWNNEELHREGEELLEKYKGGEVSKVASV